MRIFVPLTDGSRFHIHLALESVRIKLSVFPDSMVNILSFCNRAICSREDEPIFRSSTRVDYISHLGDCDVLVWWVLTPVFGLSRSGQSAGYPAIQNMATHEPPPGADIRIIEQKLR